MKKKDLEEDLLHKLKDDIEHIPETLEHLPEKFEEFSEKNHLEEKKKHIELDTKEFLEWALFGILVGLTAGFVASVFGLLLHHITAFRGEHLWLILLLPFAGLGIVFLYHNLGEKGDKGTNLILDSVRSDGNVPWYVGVRIFISTAITHLFGGSAGREGAALQLGASVSSTLAKVLKRDHKDPKATVMCGMSGSFSALFGTPLAATIFSMEVVDVGRLYYPALVPCAFAALVGSMVARFMGLEAELFNILYVPEMSPETFFKMLIIGVLSALVSILFVVALHTGHKVFHSKGSNPYVRAFVAGLVVIGLTMILRTSDYMGAGMDVIARAIQGEAAPAAFLWKIVFTALALGSYYKGGEIVPSFFVGATFGCVMGHLIGLSPSLCAGVAMVSVFCGVTNCPISSLLIAAELFGFEGIHYFLIGVAVSYCLSGYYSLYSTQRIVYDKHKARLRVRGKKVTN